MLCSPPKSPSVRACDRLCAPSCAAPRSAAEASVSRFRPHRRRPVDSYAFSTRTARSCHLLSRPLHKPRTSHANTTPTRLEHVADRPLLISQPVPTATPPISCRWIRSLALLYATCWPRFSYRCHSRQIGSLSCEYSNALQTARLADEQPEYRICYLPFIIGGCYSPRFGFG